MKSEDRKTMKNIPVKYLLYKDEGKRERAF